MGEDPSLKIPLIFFLYFFEPFPKSLAGVYDSYCNCGDSPGQKVEESICSKSCPGDSSSVCGGYARKVFSIVLASTVALEVQIYVCPYVTLSTAVQNL